ncbi:MAG: ABC transporter ATP-binding protein [Sumerlaeia bacterium]
MSQNLNGNNRLTKNDGKLELKKDDEEEKFLGAEDWVQIKRLWEYLSPRKTRIVIAVFASIALSFLILLPTILTKVIIDDYLVVGDLSGLIPLGIGMLVAMLAALVIESWTQYEIAKIGQETMRDLRMDLFRHLEKQSLRFFDKKPVGYLVTRMTSDVNVLNEFFAQGVVGIFQQFFMLLGIIGVLFYYNWQLALWSMIIVPMVYVLSSKFRKSIRFSYRLTRSRLSRMNTHIQENVAGMRAVQANTKEPKQFSEFNDLNNLHRDAHYRTVMAYSVYFPVIEFIATIGIAVVLWQGGKQYFEGFITMGELVLFISLLERFFMPIKDLSEKFNLIQSAMAAGERLFALLDTAPDITNKENAIANAPFDHTIEFKNVWFAYNDEDWVLRDVSFTLKKGQTMAIVGPTGSGKTTLMALLCRFYDVNKGQILIDGVDIRDLSISSLQDKIAIVLQDVFLFRGSVTENVRLGNEEISQEAVEESAKLVNAHDFVTRLPRGYDTGVMERGATLSVGQKQLLSFARALAAKPQILILDEATSNIDTESEHLIQDALHKLTGKQTSLVIAHRLSTIQSADTILVLQNGKKIEQGNHQELLSHGGLYRRLYELQYRDQNLTASV